MEEDRHAWERPGAFQVGPGVYRIPLPLPGDHLKAVNVYAIVDGDRLVLVDGGWAMADSTDLLDRALGSLRYRIADIRDFLVTHVHRDHYTQAVAVRRRTGSRISLGEGEAANLDATHAGWDEHPDVPALRRAGAPQLADLVRTWSSADIDLAQWEYPDRWLPDAVELTLESRTLTVLATPGHTRGHVVFVDRQAGALFAGDHVLPHITPSIGVELRRPPSPLRDYLASLRVVGAMPDLALLPAHGPVRPSTRGRVEELLAHHEQRLAATARAVAGGASSCFDVTRALTWTRRERRFDELDTFNQLLAVHETAAHLEVLVEREAVTRSPDESGVLRYGISAPGGGTDASATSRG